MTKHDLKKRDSQHNSASETCRDELDQTFTARSLNVRFRPIMSSETCSNFGYLARISGAQESPIHNIDRLFGVARQVDCVHKLTKRYLESVLSTVGHRDKPLFLPMPTIAIIDLGAEAAQLLTKALKKNDVPAESVIIIHPGLTSLNSNAITNTKAFTLAINSINIGLAAMGFGCDFSENILWSLCSPQWMLLDEGHLDDIDANGPHLEMLRRFITIDEARGRKILVQSIDHIEQFNLARKLGINFLAGDFIGKLKPIPYDTLSAAALNAIQQTGSTSTAPTNGQSLLERLLIPQAPVEPDTSADKVFALFEATPDLRSLAVVKNGKPLGIISRYEMVDNMSRPFQHELFGRKPCERFMDSDPLIMDVQINTPNLMDQVIKAHPHHLISGFIVTDHGGQYLGMGAVQDLMREITHMQIQAARYANPLTQLPGNVAINEHLNKLLQSEDACVVAYCDLDHFKPFNDVYGYAKGDEIILLTARCLNDVIDTEIDFLGHIGGDDFVIIFRSPDWQARCQRALDCFGHEVMAFFSDSDITQGGYSTANRKDEMEFHALTSLSIGAVEALPRLYDSYLEVATVAAEVKKHAKAIKGNSLYVNQRKR